VGASGWVIDKDEAKADVPFDHPWGWDWEFEMALDDNEKGYTSLLSPANASKEATGVEDAIKNAIALGLSVPPNGLLGVEWDKDLLPYSFRNQVNDGDRVAVFGRWILDEGHAYDGNFRTEIHPPLLMATGSVQQEGDNLPFTRVLFMSRPYLVGQTFCVDPKNAYLDGTDDDGSFWDHLLEECVKVIGPPVINILGIGESWKVEAHPKIKSFPFRGSHLLRFVVRPPQPQPAPGPVGGAVTTNYRLAVSFHFVVRGGCAVEVTSSATDTVEVFVALNHAGYTPPPLPNRKERNYSRQELDELSAGSGIKILELDAIMTGLGALTGGPIDAAKVAAVLSTGIKTDQYDPLPEIDVLDKGNSLPYVWADSVPVGKGISVSDDQPYPIYGWLEAKWVRPPTPGELHTDVGHRDKVLR